MSMLPADARVALKNLALATVDGSEALAADDFVLYQGRLPAMRQALTGFLGSYAHATHGPLGKFKDALPDRNDLKAARRDFAYFSTAVADLVRENHLQHTAGLRIFQCPMAPGIGIGRWLQRSGELKNPFYGSAMLECGEEIDAPSVPPSATTSASAPRGMTALPPGHPPIDGLSVAAYLRAMPDPKTTVAAAGGTCGSCGLTETAMAAGEPCAPGTH